MPPFPSDRPIGERLSCGRVGAGRLGVDSKGRRRKEQLGMVIRKQQSHGRIGEACVTAKCWMHGIPAYNTAGLRANFAGSDLIVDTPDPKRKLLIQVKTGYNPSPDWIYMTQCCGEHELEKP